MQSELVLFSNGISGTDSSVFRYVSWMMQQGYVPYKDTFDHKGPLIYLIDCIGMSLHPTRGIWMMEVIALYLGILFSYKTARLFLSRRTSFLAVIMSYSLLGNCFRGGNMTEEYAIPFIAASLYFFLNYFHNNVIKRSELFFCGVCFMAVCLLRVNMIAVWLVCIPIVLFYDIIYRKWKEMRTQIIFFLAGCLVTALPVLLYLVQKEALSQFWDVYIRFNFSYSGYLSIRERLDCYQFFLDQPLVYLAIFGLFYTMHVMGRDKGEREICIEWQIAAGCFFFTFPLMCMSGREDITYEMVLIPELVLPIGWLFSSLIDKETEDKNKVMHGASCFLVFWIMVTVAVPSLIRVWDSGLERNRFLTEKQEDEWLWEVCEAVDTFCGEDDTISVFGNKDVVYLLCGRMSASRYSFQFPIVEVRREIYQEYLRELEYNVPKVVVIDEPFAEEYVDLFRQWLDENEYEPTDSGKTIYVKQ